MFFCFKPEFKHQRQGMDYDGRGLPVSVFSAFIWKKYLGMTKAQCVFVFDNMTHVAFNSGNADC